MAVVLPMETKEQRDARLAAVRGQKLRLLMLVIDAPGATMAHVLTARKLFDYHNNDTGLCCPSRERLKADTRLSNRALSGAIADFQKAGILTMQRTGGVPRYILNLTFEGVANFGESPRKASQSRQEVRVGAAKFGDHNLKESNLEESNQSLPSGERAPESDEEVLKVLETKEAEPTTAPPPPEQQASPTKGKTHARAKPTRIPSDWQPSERIRTDPLFAGIDLDWHVAEFVNFWTIDGGTKANWDRTFRRRLGDVLGRLRGGGSRSPGANGGRLDTTRAAALAVLGDLDRARGGL